MDRDWDRTRGTLPVEPIQQQEQQYADKAVEQQAGIEVKNLMLHRGGQMAVAEIVNGVATQHRRQ
jgi:hypothetical protein